MRSDAKLPFHDVWKSHWESGPLSGVEPQELSTPWYITNLAVAGLLTRVGDHYVEVDAELSGS